MSLGGLYGNPDPGQYLIYTPQLPHILSNPRVYVYWHSCTYVSTLHAQGHPSFPLSAGMYDSNGLLFYSEYEQLSNGEKM